MSRRILVVEDELVLNKSVVAFLSRESYATEGVRSVEEARAAIEGEWGVVLLDLHLGTGSGMTLLKELREKQPDLPVVMMSGAGTLNDAVEAMRLGAHDYLRKPFEPAQLLGAVASALETRALRAGITAMREHERAGASPIVGESAPMLEVREAIRRVAASEAATVLVTGESGVGKDLVAKAIHGESRRAGGPFMTITCTAIADQLIESELFGHEKGAFTNAVARKKGLLELAAGGTVFLDEIGDLSPGLQGKLLRFLQEKTFKRVGGTEDLSVDVRIVAATHQDLKARVEEGRFRQDLYYRLKVVDIVVPPLRERREDIPLLAQALVHKFNKQLKRNVVGFAPDALALLASHSWPGNVRELKNAIERAMILGRGDVIRRPDLPLDVVAPELPLPHATDAAAKAVPAPDGRTNGHANGPTNGHSPTNGHTNGHAAPPADAPTDPYRLPPGGVDLEALKRALVVQAIRASSGNKALAGRLLGLNRDQIRYRMEKYGIADDGEPRDHPTAEARTA